MPFITTDWMVRERLREVTEQLAVAQWCLDRLIRGRKHNQTGKFKRATKKGKKR